MTREYIKVDVHIDNDDIDLEPLSFALKKNDSSKTVSSYKKAKQIRDTKLSNLITQKLLSGEGITKSFSSSISEKLKAKSLGIKEKFDPLNIAKMITGGSSLAPALLGRMMGRKQEDIEHFAGKTSKATQKNTKNKNKDPLFSSIGPGRVLPLRVNDSVTDVLAKLYNLLQSSYNRKKKENELEKSFQKTKQNKENERHKALLKAFGGFGGKGSGGGNKKDEEGSFWGPLLEGVGGIWLAKKAYGKYKSYKEKLKSSPKTKLKSSSKTKLTALDKLKNKFSGAREKLTGKLPGSTATKLGTENKYQKLAKQITPKQRKSLSTKGYEWNKGTQRFHKGGKIIASDVIAKEAGIKMPAKPTAKPASSSIKTAKAFSSFVEKLGKIPGLNAVSKSVKVLPVVGSLMLTGAAFVDVVKNIDELVRMNEANEITDDELVKGVTGQVGGLFGGLAGADVGATLGAAIGQMLIPIPIVGALAGMGAGGYFGWKIGQGGGQKVAEMAYDYISGNKTLEQIGQEALDDVKTSLNTPGREQMVSVADRPDGQSSEPDPRALKKDISKKVEKFKDFITGKKTESSETINANVSKPVPTNQPKNTANQVGTPTTNTDRLNQSIKSNNDMKLEETVGPTSSSSSGVVNNTTNVAKVGNNKSSVQMGRIPVRNSEASLKRAIEASVAPV